MDVWGREAEKEGMKWRNGPRGVTHILSMEEGAFSSHRFETSLIITQERKGVEKASMALILSSLRYLIGENLGTNV